MLTVYAIETIDVTLRPIDERRYHAIACAQTNGWRGEAIEAAIRLHLPRRRFSVADPLSAADIMALGVRIVRAQRAEARKSMECATGSRLATHTSRVTDRPSCDVCFDH